MKSESQVVVDVRSISQSPRRLRAKYTHRTNQRFVLRIFRPAGSYLCRKRQLVRKQVPMHLLTAKQARAGKENAYRQTFIYQTKQAV